MDIVMFFTLIAQTLKVMKHLRSVVKKQFREQKLLNAERDLNSYKLCTGECYLGHITVTEIRITERKKI